MPRGGAGRRRGQKRWQLDKPSEVLAVSEQLLRGPGIQTRLHHWLALGLAFPCLFFESGSSLPRMWG